MATKILLVDDHVMVREGLKEIISDQQGMEVVGEAGSYEQLLPLLAQAWDVLVLDSRIIFSPIGSLR